MAQTTAVGTTVAEVMAELAALEESRVREVNANHGDDHGVNLTKLRAVATRLKAQHEFARELWQTGETAARLLALLICRRKEFDRDDELRMLRFNEVPPAKPATRWKRRGTCVRSAREARPCCRTGGGRWWREPP